MADLATLATLLVKIKADTAELSGGLNKAKQALNKFSNIALGVGGAVTGALAGVMYETIQVGDKFDKMSKRVGESVENLSALAYVAELSGTNIDTLERGLKYLAQRMYDAKDGMESAQEAFEALGVQWQNADGSLRSVTEVLLEVSDKLNSVGSDAEKSALAAELFGMRAGPELLPLLKEGSEGITAYIQKARELGIAMTQEDAQAAAELNDAITTLKMAFAGLARELGTTLIPAITPLVEKITEVVKHFKDWTDQHPVLFEWLVKIAGYGGPLLLLVGGVGKLVGAISPLLGLLSGGGGLIASLGGLTTTFSSLLPFLGPAGLIAGGVLAVYLAWKNWDKIKDFVGGAWDAVKNFGSSVKDTLSGLGERVKGWASNFWDNFQKVNTERSQAVIEFFSKTLPQIGKGFVSLIEKANEWGNQLMLQFLNGLSDAWHHIKDWFSSIGSWIVDFFSGLLDKIKGFFANLWDKIKGGVKTAGEKISGALDLNNKNIPAYQTGGVVKSTGLALVHEGEVVLPKGVKPIQISFGDIVIAGSSTPVEAQARARDLVDMMLDELRRRGIELG